ncbi:MAG: HipA domain-containing protein [Planctomycetes bacterium]|nr:HipA domain-containing protein [Planctomycetota bacterium]
MVRLKVDENRPAEASALLRQAGHDALSAHDQQLVGSADSGIAAVCRREGRKLRQEDFCQLAELSPKEKYDGSAELCVRLLRKYASEPLIEILKPTAGCRSRQLRAYWKCRLRSWMRPRL